jgi:hypothetical protein
VIVLVGGAYVYRAGLAIDADGCPRAYHPEGSPPGLDHLANAGHPGNWWGLACNAVGVPFVQVEGDPAPGFYVATTSLVDKRKSLRDPDRYVDAAMVPYVSIPRDLTRGTTRARPGDLAVACYGGLVCGCIVADVGPAGKPGEGSMALAQALGIPSDPKHGGLSSPAVSYWVQPGSAIEAWPRAGFQMSALEAFVGWGGVERLAKELSSGS